MPSKAFLQEIRRSDDWSSVSVAVIGLGAAGMSAIDALHHVGATVIGFDERDLDERQQEQAGIFTFLGVDLQAGLGSVAELPAHVDLVIAATSAHESVLLRQAVDRDVTVWSDTELAWRLRSEESAPWLVVAGQRDVEATALLAEHLLRSAGVQTAAVGINHLQLIDAVMDPEGPAALIVCLSPEQLQWRLEISPVSAVVLNAMPNIVANPFQNVQAACIYNVQDDQTRILVEQADVIEGARAIGFSLGSPEPSMVGLVEDIVVDRAFIENRQHHAEAVFSITSLAEPEPDSIAYAMAATALVRSVGVPINVIKPGLESYLRSAR